MVLSASAPLSRRHGRRASAPSIIYARAEEEDEDNMLSASAPLSRRHARRPSAPPVIRRGNQQDSLDALLQHSRSSSRSSSAKPQRPALIDFCICAFPFHHAHFCVHFFLRSSLFSHRDRTRQSCIRARHSHVHVLVVSCACTDDGRPKHPEIIETARKEEERRQANLGPGAYNPTVPPKRRPSVPLWVAPSPAPSHHPSPMGMRRSGSVSRPISPMPVSADLPTPEIAERLTSAHTYTSALRYHLPPPPTARPVAPSVSSPRKRTLAASKVFDPAQTRRTVERLHGAKTSSYSAAKHDRAHQRESLRWGAERWGAGSVSSRMPVFPAPI